MLQLSKELAAAGRKPSVFIGYRDSNLFLKEDFEKYGTVYVATEDGSVGTKGNVLTALKETGVQPSVMMACGPMMMLRAIRHTFHWKSIWPVESEPVLDVCAGRRRKTNIHRFIMQESARRDLYFWLRRLRSK